VCADGDMKVGRIYKHTGGPQSGHWLWSMYAFGPGINRRDWNLTGTEDHQRRRGGKAGMGLRPLPAACQCPPGLRINRRGLR